MEAHSSFSGLKVEVLKLQSRIQDKQEAMRFRCYGNSCCWETDEKIKFDHMLK